MAKPVTVYKTIILYLLDKSTCPLTNQQIADFFLQKEYADYFKVQEIISELTEFGMLEVQSSHENTQYSISKAGKEALDLLDDKLNAEVKEDVKKYFDSNQMAFRRENFVFSDYKKLKADSYQVDLYIKEEKLTLLSLSLNVRTKEQAEKMCDNWKKASDEVYAGLLMQLGK